MIANLYTWIFPAALFTAVGIINLSSSVKKKRYPERAQGNKIVWFSLNISIAFCFIAASAFFVNWSDFVWSANYLYFSLIIIILFYLGYIFRYIIGLPLLFSLGFIVLFFNIYLQEWVPVTADRVLGSYRILSNNEEGITAELAVVDSASVFIKEGSSSLFLNFETLDADSSLFFIDSKSYYRLISPLSEFSWADHIIKYIAEKTFFLTIENYSVELLDEVLFLEYSIVLDPYQKKIIIEN